MSLVYLKGTEWAPIVCLPQGQCSLCSQCANSNDLGTHIPVPAAGSLLLAPVTPQRGAVFHAGSTSTLQGGPSGWGAPGAVGVGRSILGLPPPSGGTDTSKACSTPAPPAAQGCGVPGVLRTACSLSPLAWALLPSLSYFCLLDWCSPLNDWHWNLILRSTAEGASP